MSGDCTWGDIGVDGALLPPIRCRYCGGTGSPHLIGRKGGSTSIGTDSEAACWALGAVGGFRYIVGGVSRLGSRDRERRWSSTSRRGGLRSGRLEAEIAGSRRGVRDRERTLPAVRVAAESLLARSRSECVGDGERRGLLVSLRFGESDRLGATRARLLPLLGLLLRRIFRAFRSFSLSLFRSRSRSRSSEYGRDCLVCPGLTDIE